MSEPTAEADVLHPAQRVYALSVNAAMAKYQAAVAAAERERRREVDEALQACIQAMEATRDE